MRVCLAYDCLYPWTVGGAERWYRCLAERLAADGHDVTYLTRLQWDRADPPEIPGVRVIAVCGAGELYGPDGNRRVGPPLRFGAGVLRHLARHGRDYNVVHMCSFPYFSVLAAALTRPLGRYRLVVDWFEIWSRDYWRDYLGPVGGRIGYLIQRICVRVPQRAQCFSRLHEQRLVDEGLRGEHVFIGGLYDEPRGTRDPAAAESLVVFAGRHIPEKRAPAAVEAIALARSEGLDVRGLIFGDGPEREQVLATISRLGVEDYVSAPGFVDRAEVDDAMRRALCLLHPSAREGYGLVVIESAARGTPVVVAAGPDNAAVELVDSGENGVVARSGSPADLAAALHEVTRGGDQLRQRTRAWFARNEQRVSIEASLERVTESYSDSTNRVGER